MNAVFIIKATERQITQVVLYHIVLPGLNIKYSIVGKYFPEINSISVT